MATRTYIDIDLNFTKHPVTGDISMKYDAAAIKASVKNLVMTAHYERRFHSEIGSDVPNLMFELMGPAHAFRLKKTIEDVINNFEPRVDLINVSVVYSDDLNTVNVTILFRIKNTETTLSVDVPLERTR
jgi:phage baseplate assembly protein W